MPHSKGIACAAWQATEVLHSETEIRETFTPCFDQQNIRFHINKCRFRMVEFFRMAHPEPDMDFNEEAPGGDGFCRFEKKMK